MNYDPTIEQFVYLEFKTDAHYVFRIGQKTTTSSFSFHTMYRFLIGIKSQTIKNLKTGQRELDTLQFVFNGCAYSDQVPEVTEYMAMKFGGDSTAKSIRYVSQNINLENSPDREGDVSKWSYVIEVPNRPRVDPAPVV